MNYFLEYPAPFYLIYMFFCGLITRSMYDRRGKTRGGCFWWGFVFGIIGILIVAKKNFHEILVVRFVETPEEITHAYDFRSNVGYGGVLNVWKETPKEKLDYLNYISHQWCWNYAGVISENEYIFTR